MEKANNQLYSFTKWSNERSGQLWIVIARGKSKTDSHFSDYIL